MLRLHGHYLNLSLPWIIATASSLVSLPSKVLTWSCHFRCSTTAHGSPPAAYHKKEAWPPQTAAPSNVYCHHFSPSGLCVQSQSIFSHFYLAESFWTLNGWLKHYVLQKTQKLEVISLQNLYRNKCLHCSSGSPSTSSRVEGSNYVWAQRLWVLGEH